LYVSEIADIFAQFIVVAPLKVTLESQLEIVPDTVKVEGRERVNEFKFRAAILLKVIPVVAKVTVPEGYKDSVLPVVITE
jgi:hypothetical protein